MTTNKADKMAGERSRRARAKKIQAGMKSYLLWFDKDVQQQIVQLKEEGETLSALFMRALSTLEDTKPARETSQRHEY